MWASVELRELRVFLALAEELHFGRTGERLGITHSRVSQTIRTLEARIGGRLFERTSRRVRLTPVGEELRRRIAPAYEQLERAYADVRELAIGAAGTLRLGVYAYPAGGPRMLEIIKSFESRHPACKVQVTETGFVRDQLDWLRHDELDLLVMHLPTTDPDVAIGPVLTVEERVLAVAVDHPLARQSSVCVEDLADYTTTYLPTLPREWMDSFSPTRTPSGRPIHRVRISSIGEAAVRAATGELVHPTVRGFFDHYPHPGVTAIPIRDLPPSASGLVWLKARTSLKVQAFAQAAAEAAQGEPHLR